MSQYLIIESRDPFESPDVKQSYALASDLGQSGHKVTLFLIQNGVLATRVDAKADLSSGDSLKVLADDYSLNERGIKADGLASGVAISSMDDLVDLMVDSQTKIIWH